LRKIRLVLAAAPIAGEIDPRPEDRMRTTTVIVVAMIVAIVGHSVTGGAPALPPVAEEGLMPSPFQMMSDARDLPATPSVAP
jgi:hypothetical protein